jgi:predicted acyltransferase
MWQRDEDRRVHGRCTPGLLPLHRLSLALLFAASATTLTYRRWRASSSVSLAAAFTLTLLSQGVEDARAGHSHISTHLPHAQGDADSASAGDGPIVSSSL